MNTEKILDLMQSSRTHHSFKQHKMLWILYRVAQSHMVAMRGARATVEDEMRTFLSESFIELMSELSVLLSLSESEFKEVANHLDSVLQALVDNS